jgi:hypothetical protein
MPRLHHCFALEQPTDIIAAVTVTPAGTLVGCLPNNLVAVNAGSHLRDLNSLSDLYSGRLLALCAAVGCVALAPTLMKQRHSVHAAAAGAAQVGKLA